MYLIVFNIEQHYYRIFNAVYMIYEEERTKKMISVIKRDGHRATYDRNKIVSAIQKANTEVDQEERISEEQIYNILASIENHGSWRYSGYYWTEAYGREEICSCKNIHHLSFANRISLAFGTYLG